LEPWRNRWKNVQTVPIFFLTSGTGSIAVSLSREWTKTISPAAIFTLLIRTGFRQSQVINTAAYFVFAGYSARHPESFPFDVTLQGLYAVLITN
jgi:hypothetical protein